MKHGARILTQSAVWFLLLGSGVLLLAPRLRASSSCDGAGNCYIRAGAKGLGSGTTWTDAYTGFGVGTGQVDPANLQRGVVYWIASGNYGGVAFTTPDSGSSRITIQGATNSSHGPATDWDSSFAGQAVFGESAITSDNWAFNGQVRNADWRSGYTLKFWNPSSPQGFGVALGTYLGGVDNISFKYVEMQGTGLTGGAFPGNSTADRCSEDNCGVWMDGNVKVVQPCTNIYFGYGYYHHTGNSQFWFNNTGPGGLVSSNLTWEYNWIAYNHTGQNGQHDEAYSLLANQATIRYNIFQDISGSGIIVDASAGSPPLSDWFIYGNLFFNDAAYLALGQNYWLNTVDQGIVVLGDGNGTPLSEQLSGTFLFANNTIANFNPPGASCLGTYSTLPIAGTGMLYGDANVIVENNLWFRSYCVHGNYTPLCNHLNGACTRDYNASYAGGLDSSANWTTQELPALHDVNVSGQADPFVNSAGLDLEGFQLLSPDPFIARSGVALGAPFDYDMLGTPRGANGAWDLGALQTGTSTALIPTTVALSTASTSLEKGATATFIASVIASGGGTPTGTVSFANGPAELGSVALDASGTATFTTSSLRVGTSILTANYSGDARYAASASAALAVTVTPAPPAATTMMLTSSASKIAQGAALRLAASVSLSDASLPSIPRGEVDFCEGTTPPCADAHLLGSAQLDREGSAVFTFHPLAGDHLFLAQYAGDPNGDPAALASSSSPVPVKVSGNATVAISASGSPDHQTLTAAVTGLDSTLSPTGSVAFLDLTTNQALGTQTLGVATHSLAFETGAVITGATVPAALATADFHDYGHLDLAVTDSAANSLLVLIGDGSGQFVETSQKLMTGKQPQAIATGDFNSDGYIDLAVANAGSDNLSIFLGNTDGTFRPEALNPTTGHQPTAISAADFNLDGIPDLAVANAADDSLTVLLGNGDGTFTPLPSTKTGKAPVSIATADFDGDEVPDLAVANSSSNDITVLLGKGDGNFRAPPLQVPVGSHPIAILAGEFNGDGKADLASANRADSTVTVLFGDGHGSFAAPRTLSVAANPSSIISADLNGDGALDLVATGSNDGALTILLGKLDGTFTAMPNAPHVGAQAIAALPGDLQGNGVPDILIANQAGDPLTLLKTTLVSTAATSLGNIAFSGPASHHVKAIYSGDSNFAPAESTALVIEPVPTTATPTFSVPGGTYASMQTVALLDATPEASIYYTLDGTTPGTTSLLYAQPLVVSSSQTIQAIATALGHTTSSIATATYTIAISNPVPSLASTSPHFLSAGNGATTLTVKGTGFLSSSVILWAGAPLATTFVSTTQLTALLASDQLVAQGTVAVFVQNPAPGGGVSNALQFEIDSPAAATMGAPAFSPASAIISSGGTAIYRVTLPAGATNVSATCLNLPAASTCAYSATTATLNIATSSTTPRGAYDITVVFATTVPARGSAAWFPLLLLPWTFPTRRRRMRASQWLAALALALLSAAILVGCGGSASSSTSSPPPTQQVTSSAVVTLTIE